MALPIYSACSCGRRIERHWAIDGVPDWLIFLAANGLGGKKHIRGRLMTPGESAGTDWDSITLWSLVLEEIWHAGSVPVKASEIRRIPSVRAHPNWRDFTFACARVCAALEKHPEIPGRLWLADLEALRRRECDLPGMTVLG